MAGFEIWREDGFLSPLLGLRLQVGEAGGREVWGMGSKEARGRGHAWGGEHEGSSKVMIREKKTYLENH